MVKEALGCIAVLGLDVGKSSHWACLVTRAGEIALNGPVANAEADLDALFSQAPEGALVVVDQARNIGSLAIRRARLAGLPVAYLPGIAAHRAAGLFAGDAKTDEALDAARMLASQRDHMVTCATRDKNRLRSILLESCPAFEALVDLSDARWLSALERLGGPWGIADAGKASFGAVTRGADRARMDAAWAAIGMSTRPSEARVAAENPMAKMLARRIREAVGEASQLDGEISRLLAGDDTYRCLATSPA